MAVTSICGGCHTAIEFPIQDMGRVTSCPHCGAEVVVGVAQGTSPAAGAKATPSAASPAPKAKAAPAAATAAPIRVAKPLATATPIAAAKPAPSAKPAVAAAAAPPVKGKSPAAAPAQPASPIAIQTSAPSPSSRVSAKRPKQNSALLIVGSVALVGLLVVGGLGAVAIVAFGEGEEEAAPLVTQLDTPTPTIEDDFKPLPSPGGETLPSNFPPVANDDGPPANVEEKPVGEEKPAPPIAKPRETPKPPIAKPRENPKAPIDDPFDDPVMDIPVDDGDEPETKEPLPRPQPERPVAERPIPVTPDRPIEKPALEEKEPESDDPLIGRVATMLYVVRGEQKLLENVRIAAIDPGKEESSVKSIQFRLENEPETKRARKLPIEQIVRIVVGDRRHDVRFDRRSGVYTIVDALKRREEVGANLRKQGHQLWELLTDEEQAKYVEEHRQFITAANAKMGGRLQIQENEFFIFGSDLPPIEAEQSLAYLTAMYTKLCAMFGVMPGENIWRGKCVIIVFRQEADYFAFEQQVMENPAPQGTAGLHHGYRDGKTIITCQRGKDPAFYRSVLVHETVHGFVHRFQSSVHVPSWINEGIADWVSDVVVPDSNEVKMRRAAARRELAQSRQLGDEFFKTARITASQYGIASDITDFMLQSDPAGYRYFLEGVKEGKSWEESLQESFGITQEQLAALYFQNRVGR